MTVYEAVQELQERLHIIKKDFRGDPMLQSYAEALSMAVEALKAKIPDELDDPNELDDPDELDDDHIDADIQAADMAAEDMEDNTEEDWP